jgi:hypothetical protein
MSQNTEQKENFESEIEWKELDEVIRRWAALTGHENDQDWYKKMKEY